MGELSWNTLKQMVYERAHGCCEYCQTCEANSGQTMQVDHIDPRGDDVLANLCLSCWNCNSSKHKATLVIDPETGARVPLFNPRTQAWSEHFEWLDGGTRVRGLSPIGRATVTRLKMNRPAMVVARQRWAEGGYHPPQTAWRRESDDLGGDPEAGARWAVSRLAWYRTMAMTFSLFQAEVTLAQMEEQ